MKVIGQGWQYTTYDLGNGRVLKRYNSLVLGYWVILKTIYPFVHDKLWEVPGFYRGCKEMARDSMKKVTARVLDDWMMGNPKVLGELDYEQDMLIPLHDRLDRAPFAEAKEWIDKFVGFNKILVERNLIDKSFNITKNFGIDAEERVVLMDLGELLSDRDKINNQRRKRQWTYPYVADCILDKEVRAYYIDQMDKAFGIPAPEEM